jgi:hypothetical protein
MSLSLSVAHNRVEELEKFLDRLTDTNAKRTQAIDNL